MLMSNQKTNELVHGNRSNLAPQSFKREPMDSREQSAIAPFQFTVAVKAATQNRSFAFECQQCTLDIQCVQCKYSDQVGNRGWTQTFHPAANHVGDGFITGPVVAHSRR